jgi:hypothetical protein
MSSDYDKELAHRRALGTNKLWEEKNRIQREVDAGVKKVMSSAGVDSTIVPKYHNFARHLTRAKTKWEKGNILNQEVSTLITLWSGRGCDKAILLRIVKEVFDIDYPKGK